MRANVRFNREIYWNDFICFTFRISSGFMVRIIVILCRKIHHSLITVEIGKERDTKYTRRKIGFANICKSVPRCNTYYNGPICKDIFVQIRPLHICSVAEISFLQHVSNLQNVIKSNFLSRMNTLNARFHWSTTRVDFQCCVFSTYYTYGVLRTRKLVHWRVLSIRT